MDGMASLLPALARIDYRRRRRTEIACLANSEQGTGLAVVVGLLRGNAQFNETAVTPVLVDARARESDTKGSDLFAKRQSLLSCNGTGRD